MIPVGLVLIISDRGGLGTDILQRTPEYLSSEIQNPKISQSQNPYISLNCACFVLCWKGFDDSFVKLFHLVVLVLC